MQINKIVYSNQSLEVFKDEIDNYGEIETGGVLLGYIEDSTIFIEKASNGGPKAIHEYMYFQADADYIDMFIDIEVANSLGKLRYIGEWHTHSQIRPEPSSIDLQSLYEISETSKDFSTLLIIGVTKFSKKKFKNSSISILKQKNEDEFYFLDSIIQTPAQRSL